MFSNAQKAVKMIGFICGYSDCKLATNSTVVNDVRLFMQG